MTALFNEAIGGQHDGFQHRGLCVKHGAAPHCVIIKNC